MAEGSRLSWQHQQLNPRPKHMPFPGPMPQDLHPALRPCLPTAHAYPSQCPGTAGYGSHCPSLHPQYSNIPATSHFGPRYCHTHLEPLCRSSTLGARCSRDPAWGGWVSEVGVGVEAWLEDWGWQVLGAVSLGTCLKEEMALARHMLCFLISYVGDGGGVGVGAHGHGHRP